MTEGLSVSFCLFEVVAVPVAMQQRYTAPVLSSAGAPPMYTTIPASPVSVQMEAGQAQPRQKAAVQQLEDTKNATIG